MAVLAALYFMLNDNFAMPPLAAADSQLAELQLLDCSSAPYDDIGMLFQCSIVFQQRPFYDRSLKS